MLARVKSDKKGAYLVLAPGVGLWSQLPSSGALLGPGSPIGTLRQLNRSWHLFLPGDADMGTAGDLPRKRTLAVDYGQPLFRVTAVGGSSLKRGGTEETEGSRDIATGSGTVVSPTDGVFYRRPSPEAPPFVEVGSRIDPGQPIGLVEVMKTFNQILYDGPGCKEQAEVVEIRCADAQEVSAGQILIVVR
jgi:acetyl-CoA carboxylase biotin carboxyl carrier protein